MLHLDLLIKFTSSGCSHCIQSVQILNLWTLSHFRTKESECVNTVTSQFTADAAVGPFLQDVLRISSLSSSITAGTCLTSGTKDSECVNMTTSVYRNLPLGPLNNFYLEWFIFLRVPCYKMHKKKNLLLWFTFLSKPEMIFLPLMIHSYNFTRHTKKKLHFLVLVLRVP